MAFSANTNHQISQYTAFAVAEAVRNEFKNVWTSAFPLIKALKHKATNFNTGFTIKGQKMVIPVIGEAPSGAAVGVSDANELTGQTLYISNGMTDAEYQFTHYRSTQTYRESELKIAKNGHIGNILQGKAAQVKDDFKTRWSTDAGGASADSRTAVMGIRYALSTSNTVGNISQSTNDYWQAHVTAFNATTTLAALDAEFDWITSKGRTEGDLILASNTGGVNVYGKIRALLGPSERVIDPEQFQSVGFRTFSYMGAPVILNNYGASGEALVLSTDTWYVHMPDAPTSSDMFKISGTDAYEQTFTLWSCIGVSDPASNSRITGLS